MSLFLTSKVISEINALTFIPIKHAFFVRVQMPDFEDNDKRHHRPEHADANGADGLQITHRPRVHENHLDVEQDKNHRHNVKFHGKTRLGFGDGIFAALVSDTLRGVIAPFFPQQHGQPHATNGDTQRNNELKNYRKIIANHGKKD